jgi:uncharacterized damage-inducible protein DinB
MTSPEPSVNLMEDFDRPVWSKRRFTFGQPQWMLADFIERLRGVTPRITALVTGISDDVAHRRYEGKWSIAQNVGHLADVEDLWQERLEDLRRRRDVYTPADPARSQKAAERHQGTPLVEIIRELETKRGQLVAAMIAAPRELQLASVFHERLQCPMRLIDCAQFYAEHDDHHLLRVRTLLGIFQEESTAR